MPLKDPIARQEYNRARYLAKREQHREQRKAYYQANKESIKALVREYGRLNRNTKNAYNRKWNAEHPERARLHHKQSYIRHLGSRQRYAAARYLENKDILLERGKQWVQRNRGLARAAYARRRAAKLQATPPWTTPEMVARIAEVYKFARALELRDGIPRHVDHIYPLQGTTCCGLHVPWNLQILAASANQRKSNKLPIIDR